MNIKRRDFIRAGGMLAIAGGASAAAGAAEVPAEAPAGAVRVSQDVPVLGDYDVCVVGAGPG
ncbi:MAG: dihydrolipoyl dehydrogenase, partial [Kiritimatiellae bacterium]|nr:dihydrolipoyl dehydrogenase [Kiritimatiellia bacterium]